MRKLLTLIVFFTMSALSSVAFAQSRIMTIHTKDKEIIECYVTDVDSITFRTGTIVVDLLPYTPTFKHTNITTDAWDDFQICKDTLFVTATLWDRKKYENGAWVDVANLVSGISPIMKEHNNKIYITEGNQVFVEREDGTGYEAIITSYQDMTGFLGGTAKSFFAGAGTYDIGIYKINEDNTFTDVYLKGTWYSWVTQGENVFFGGGDTHVEGNHGVVYWSDSENKICETNLNSGVYTLESYKDIVFATGRTISATQGDPGTYRFNGSSFDKLYDVGGVLKVTGGALYFLNGSVVYKYNDITNSFEEFHTNDDGNIYTQIEEHDGFLYIFGLSYVEAFHEKSDTWLQVEIDVPEVNVDIAKSTKFGLFVSNKTHTYAGIRKMEPKYE